MSEKICNSCGNHKENDSNFASELLRGYKKQCRNWFIIALVELCMIFGIVTGFVHFLNQYEFETYVQDGNGVNNYNTSIDGDVNNGTSNP